MTALRTAAEVHGAARKLVLEMLDERERVAASCASLRMRRQIEAQAATLRAVLKGLLDMKVVPDVVYRGSSGPANRETSAMADGLGVYVSERKSDAAQWGDVQAYRIVKHPALLDLLSPEARPFIAAQLGEDVAEMTAEDFEAGAGDVFIQCRGADRLRALGFDGMRLGYDLFLLGNLGQWAAPL